MPNLSKVVYAIITFLESTVYSIRASFMPKFNFSNVLMTRPVARWNHVRLLHSPVSDAIMVLQFWLKDTLPMGHLVNIVRNLFCDVVSNI